jgi:hypothetical protein
MLMAMETRLACSSAAAESFISLSPPFREFRLISRRSTSAAHLAFDQPDGLSFGARGFLAFGTPSSPIFFGDMVVDGKRRSYNCGEWR